METILENLPIKIEENFRNNIPQDVINIIDSYLVGQTDSGHYYSRGEQVVCPDYSYCCECKKNFKKNQAVYTGKKYSSDHFPSHCCYKCLRKVFSWGSKIKYNKKFKYDPALDKPKFYWYVWESYPK